MKIFAKSMTVILALIVYSSSQAGTALTDNQHITQCRASVIASIGDVENIKVAKIKSRPGRFEAKFRVVANGERSLVLCKTNRENVVAVSCIKGTACKAENVSAIAN